MEKNDNISERISALENRFDVFEDFLSGISKKILRQKHDPLYLSWTEAADLVGVSPMAMKKRVQRSQKNKSY